MNNAEWCIKNNIHFKDLRNVPCFSSQFESIGYYGTGGQYHELYKGEVLGNTAAMSILTWLDMKHKEPILDDVERQYLSAVIKPFRDRVQCIVKVYTYNGYYIFIKFTDESHDMDFPIFNKENMYKGMKPYDKYTLEELGL